MEKSLTEYVRELEKKRVAALEVLVQAQPVNIDNIAKSLIEKLSKSHLGF